MDLREYYIPMIARLPKCKLVSIKINMLSEYLCIATPGLFLEASFFVEKRKKVNQFSA
ncbi:hypothetical protein Amet_0939 [Alkaliphilus metalliredigens QYMF]|uniref:Uncharacterized protein n=1 Tax=Alkaliphilus metalliredigens (strain QYMF) TaxID=293826 RepID=A6TLU1_ALKMQ|nr:hypothetical protein Amet_0939 [Alkaliphilus metalliredigens QYMF]